MAYVAVDMSEIENIFDEKPFRKHNEWYPSESEFVQLPRGSIEKLIGKKLTWEDEPVELEEQHSNYAKGGYVKDAHTYAGIVHK